MINHPIIDFEIVQECQRYSEEVAKGLKQRYVITTLDLGVCMKEFPLVWSNSKKYKNHIVMIGTFNLICAYFKIDRKRFEPQV